MNKEEELIDRLIDLAFAEDIGDGDHTTLSCIPATACLLYTSPSPRDRQKSRMPSSA